MIRTFRTGALAAGALVLLFSMSGCVGSVASPTPDVERPTPTVEPLPIVEPADPLTAVVGLVARPEGLELRDDDDAVVTTLDYMSSPADAVTTLTTVFGSPPVDEPYAATNHGPGGVFHRWDLFVLDERLYDEVRRQAEGYDWLVWPRFAVYFDGPAADGVVLSTSSGRQAGDGWAEVETDAGFDSDIWTCVGTSIEAAATAAPDEWLGPDRVNVVVVPSDDGTVKWVGAPEMEVDGCA
jgi:hypothetical protein